MIRLYNMFNFKIEPDLKWNERSIEEEKNPTATRLTYLFSVWKAAHWSTLDGSCSSTIYNPFECEKSNDQIVNPRLSERAAVLFFLFAHGSGSLLCCTEQLSKMGIGKIKIIAQLPPRLLRCRPTHEELTHSVDSYHLEKQKQKLLSEKRWHRDAHVTRHRRTISRYITLTQKEKETDTSSFEICFRRYNNGS